GYPPFQRLARLIVRGRDQAAAADFAERLANSFQTALQTLGAKGPLDVRLLGPAEAPVFRLKGYFRFHFQLQSPSSATLHQLLRGVVPTVRPPKDVDLTVDIDPLDMV